MATTGPLSPERRSTAWSAGSRRWSGHPATARGIKADALAGAAVAALLVPQAMAYALLAGLRPRAGLLAAIVRSAPEVPPSSG